MSELSAACGPHCIDGYCCDRRPAEPEVPQELVDRLAEIEAEVRVIEAARRVVASPAAGPHMAVVWLCLGRREDLGWQVAANARRRLGG
jgi:hypothetical protein